MSKTNQNRTKKVKHTTAVVTALKSASKNHNNGSVIQGNKVYQDAQRSRNTEDFLRQDFEKEADSGLNNDKSSLTYGLPELDTDSNTQGSGTIGYWDHSDKCAVTIPYFGLWGKKVSSSRYICRRY